MKSLPPLHPRPSVILVLELLGIDEPSMPEGRRRHALNLVERYLGRAIFDDRLAKRQELHLFITGRQVLRVAPIKPGGTRLFDELLDVVHLQGDLIPEGVFVRGALTLGDAAAHASRVIGSGLAHAEHLCAEVAGVPRVIVDSRLIREAEGNANLRAGHHTVPQELGYIKEFLRQDGDGLWFVDYLKASASEMEDRRDYSGFLKDHRGQIERQLDAAGQLDGSSRAWTWLWQYHNAVVDEQHEEKWIDGDQRARLRIPAQSPLLYTFPPSAKPPG